jgi:uncharacterized membrane protein
MSEPPPPPPPQSGPPEEPSTGGGPGQGGPGQGLPGQGGPGQATTSTGLDPQISGLLTYILGLITGIIFYVLEKEHREVRFHAAQSILVSIVAIVISIAFSILMAIPVLGIVFGLLNVLVGLGFFVLWIVLLIKGYNLEHFKLPVIGDMAEDWAAKS